MIAFVTTLIVGRVYAFVLLFEVVQVEAIYLSHFRIVIVYACGILT